MQHLSLFFFFSFLFFFFSKLSRTVPITLSRPLGWKRKRKKVERRCWSATFIKQSLIKIPCYFNLLNSIIGNSGISDGEGAVRERIEARGEHRVGNFVDGEKKLLAALWHNCAGVFTCTRLNAFRERLLRKLIKLACK